VAWLSKEEILFFFKDKLLELAIILLKDGKTAKTNKDDIINIKTSPIT
jgi:hypothetical protein